MNPLHFARRLRTEATDCEQRLWRELRARRFQGFKFKRQQPIGIYIVDFICLERRLIIELDGGQHADATGYDEQRDAWLRSQNFEVVRYWNNDVVGNLAGVLESILMHCRRVPSPPAPPPQGGRGENRRSLE